MTNFDSNAPSTLSNPASSRGYVYVVDGDSDIRCSLHALLSGIDIVSWPFGNAADFIEQLDKLEPAPVLLDIGFDGSEVLEALKSRRFNWPVIVTTAHGSIADAVRMMKLGAIEFLEKPFRIEALQVALERAFEISSTASVDAHTQDAARQRFKLLTMRESEVIDALMLGLPNKGVANRLSLSTRTIEMHRANALRKLGARSIMEIVSHAANAGLLVKPAIAA